MGTLASTIITDKDAVHHFVHSRNPEETVPACKPVTALVRPLQRKALCACGGGCPECQGKSAELKVSQPNDPAEIEADRIADKVMRMTDTETSSNTNSLNSSKTIQHKCDACEEEDEETIQRKVLPFSSGIPSESPTHVHEAVGSGGSPLDRGTRSFFEPRLGYDLSSVRIHTGGAAAESAQDLSAHAYTIKNNIVFNKYKYSPDTSQGRKLLAHELAHVIQQEKNQKPTIRRYTPAEHTRCPCLNWSLARMFLTAQAMVTGGQFTNRPYAAYFMDQFLHGTGRDQYVRFDDFKADAGGKFAFDRANDRLSNEFLAEADALPCGRSRSGTSKHVTVPGHFEGPDLLYAMGGFSISASGKGTVRKNCNTENNCTGIEIQINIQYRINDLYDWKAEPGGCTPSTGETGCRANTKVVTLPVFGVICDECLNRLAIHGWATEFMVKVRGIANNYRVSGPCRFRNPTTEPSVRDNQGRD